MHPVIIEKSKLTNLFLVGAMKSGTTSASQYLSQYEEIFSPKVKEPNFFCTDLHRHPHSFMNLTIHNFSGHYHIKRLSKYLAFYENAPISSNYRLDSSPSYLYSISAAQNIFDFNPGAMIVILLRDPVMRAWSEYQMNVAIGVETQSFRQAIENELHELRSGRTFLFKRYILAGLYASQVQRYIELFQRKQVFIGVVDRPREGLLPVLKRVIEFLDIPLNLEAPLGRENEARVPLRPSINSLLYHVGLKAIVSQITPENWKNSAKRVYYESKNQPMPPSDQQFLREIFAESNMYLRDALNIDNLHWI